jgi:hypothetical protein
MNRKTELLEEMYVCFINTGKFPNRDDFRNEHYKDFDALDSMEGSSIIKNDNGLYIIPLVELAKTKFWGREKVICDRLLSILKTFRLNGHGKDRTIDEISQALVDVPGVEAKDIQRGLYYLNAACLFENTQTNPNTGDFKAVRPREEVLRYSTIEERIESLKNLKTKNTFPSTLLRALHSGSIKTSVNPWTEIQAEYDYSKLKFARQVNFLPPFKRGIVIRDVVQAFSCLKMGFYKPATILSGGVIEEILRLYLKHNGYPTKNERGNKRFEELVNDCKQYKLVGAGIANLAHAFRDFRNFAHLAKETKQRSIDRPTAIGAVSAIFSVASNLLKPPVSGKSKTKVYKFRLKKM